MTTPVIFRKDSYGVTAVFPTLPAGRGEMTCYAHIGQHSGLLRHVWLYPAYIKVAARDDGHGALLAS